MASHFTFENMYRAYLDCRRRKRGKKAALDFEVNAEENILGLVRELAGRTYRPSPSFCFVAQNDKYREVFASAFRDRVVHHLLVRYLEKTWEPIFIHDTYACRKGKGTHAAVRRLQSFLRSVTANGTKRAWCAQLDVKAFFPSIDRKILLDIIVSKLQSEEMRWLAEVLIMHDPTEGPVFTCSPSKWRNIPIHKSLFSVPGGTGLPIGNFTSQFFANVYLNGLDQYIKHTLKAGYYVRYVDDLILLHESKEQLVEWKSCISEFLQRELQLELHPHRRKVLPVSNGIDFLGYIVKPFHMLVRRRVVDKCRRSVANHLSTITGHNENEIVLVFPPEKYNRLHATIVSYLGVFQHAASHCLVQSLFQRFEILGRLYIHRGYRLTKRWEVPFRPANLYTQYRFFRRRFRGLILFQVGCYIELYDKDAFVVAEEFGLRRILPRRGFQTRCGVHTRIAQVFLRGLSNRNYLLVIQSNQRHGRVAKRSAARMHLILECLG